MEAEKIAGTGEDGRKAEGKSPSGPGRRKAGKGAAQRPRRRRHVLPGFGLSLGFALTYLSLIVLIPLAAAFLKAFSLSFAEWRAILTDPQILAAFRVSFVTSFGAALLNGFFGFILAWALVRFTFPGKRIFDAMVDLPFALPTAVAGIALTAVFSATGWVGRPLSVLGIEVAYTQLGILLALTFIGLPFVVRTLQPVLTEMDANAEEAAHCLGATRWQTFRHVLFPVLLPGLLTGTSLAFARALGEYGSVIFISGNLPFKTEIVPLLIVSKLEQYDYAGATAVAVLMLCASFLLLLLINLLQRWTEATHAP